MKRVAEKQLIKEDGGTDGDDGEEGVQGFRKADAAVLATRKIRGLPKRSSAAEASNSTAGTPPGEPVSKFAGFNGFGQTSKPLPPLATSSTTTGSSNAAKTFASFLGGASNGTDARATPPVSSEDDKAAVQYYSSLRGLNISILKAINKYVEADPFVDISDTLERYRNLRSTVQKDFDSKKSGSVSKPDATAVAAAPPVFSMPIPPTSFAPFKSSSTSSEKKSDPPVASGFVFKPSGIPSSNPSPFPFISSNPKPTDSSSPESFSFEQPSASTTAVPVSSAKPGFTFGAPSKDTTSSGFPFGGSGTNGSSTSLPFSLTPSSTSTGSITVFGSKANNEGKEEKAAAPSNPFSMPSSTREDKPTSTLFGTPSSSGAAFGGFGSFFKPASSSGAVNFTFGSGSSQAESKLLPSFGGFSSSGTTSGFSFGGNSSAIAASDKKDEGEDAKQEEEGSVAASGSATPAEQATGTSMLGVNPHDAEGEGEEDEETVHAAKSKVYRMKKPDEKGGPGWVEIGYGILRLKKHKMTDVRRMLLRNSTTGKININFVLYSGLKPSHAKKAVTFVGHDNGVAQTYSVRVGSEGQAKELREVLEREIASIK